ncbi:MAG: hypothetical protein QM820_13140 [Minicystis sp.]
MAVEFVTPSADDAKEAARLRRLGLGPNGKDYGHWLYFFKSSQTTHGISPKLSPAARKQLGLHLFLHHAFYGSEDIPHLNTAALDAITEPSLQAEVAALRLEIAVARLDPKAAKLRNEMLARWPGMQHRIEEIDQGEGLLTYGRERWQGGHGSRSGSSHTN